MIITVFVIISNILIIVLSTVITIIWKINKKQFQVLTIKQEIIWDYILSRATLEFLHKDMGTINSPTVVTSEVKKMFAPITDDLKKHYINVGVDLTDNELFQMIFKEYGKWIFDNVCIPHKLENGACIIAAMSIAKGE